MSLKPEEYFDYALGYLDTLFSSHKEKEHKRPEDLFFLSHLMEIYDLAADAKTLLNSKSCTSFLIIFRTLFEIFLNIRIVDANPSKYEKLRYEYLKQVIKDLSIKLNPKNRLLSDTSQEIRQALSKRKKEATLELNELSTRNVCEFKIEEKFEIG